MLSVQVEYWKLQETKKHNRAVEAYNQQTLQYNYAVLAETGRHNRETESISWYTAKEQNRHNTQMESLTAIELKQNYDLGRMNVAENRRHHIAEEKQAKAELESISAYRRDSIQVQKNQNALTERRDRFNYYVGQSNATAALINAETSRLNYYTNTYDAQTRRMSALTAQENAKTNRANMNVNQQNANTNWYNAETGRLSQQASQQNYAWQHEDRTANLAFQEHKQKQDITYQYVDSALRFLGTTITAASRSNDQNPFVSDFRNWNRNRKMDKAIDLVRNSY